MVEAEVSQQNDRKARKGLLSEGQNREVSILTNPGADSNLRKEQRQGPRSMCGETVLARRDLGYPRSSYAGSCWHQGSLLLETDNVSFPSWGG